MRLSSFVTVATIGVLYQSKIIIDDGDCAAIGGMKIGRGNQGTRKKNLLQYHFVRQKSHMT
jgi:hypothetical protein